MAKKAKDTIYLYSGSLSGVTLDDGREIMLHPAAEVPLPGDNAYVKALVAQKLLTPVSATAAPPVAVKEVQPNEGGEETHAS